jgi:hypothetical protein
MRSLSIPRFRAYLGATTARLGSHLARVPHVVLLDSTFCLLSGFTETWRKVETFCHVRFAQRIALPLEVRLFRAR